MARARRALAIAWAGAAWGIVAAGGTSPNGNATASGLPDEAVCNAVATSSICARTFGCEWMWTVDVNVPAGAPQCVQFGSLCEDETSAQRCHAYGSCAVDANNNCTALWDCRNDPDVARCVAQGCVEQDGRCAQPAPDKGATDESATTTLVIQIIASMAVVCICLLVALACLRKAHAEGMKDKALFEEAAGGGEPLVPAAAPAEGAGEGGGEGAGEGGDTEARGAAGPAEAAQKKDAAVDGWEANLKHVGVFKPQLHREDLGEPAPADDAQQPSRSNHLTPGSPAAPRGAAARPFPHAGAAAKAPDGAPSGAAAAAMPDSEKALREKLAEAKADLAERRRNVAAAKAASPARPGAPPPGAAAPRPTSYLAAPAAAASPPNARTPEHAAAHGTSDWRERVRQPPPPANPVLPPARGGERSRELLESVRAATGGA